MKKLAVCLSGVPKHSNIGYESIQKYFPDADIFAQIWDTTSLDITNKTAYSYHTYSVLAKPEDVINKYKPKLYKIDNFSYHNNAWLETKQNYENQGVVISQHSTSMLSMFYALTESFRLKNIYEKTNNFKYDNVIRMRYDSNIINWQSNYLEIKNTIFIPIGGDNAKDGINDQFSFGDNETMNKVGYIFNNLDNIILSCKLYNPEFCFAEHLRRVNILPNNVTRINIQVNINGN